MSPKILKFLEKSFFVLFVALCCGVVVSFLGAILSRVGLFDGVLPSKVLRYLDLASVVSAICAGAAFLLSRIASSLSRESSPVLFSSVSDPRPHTKSPWMLLFQVVVSVYIVGVTSHEVFHGALDSDETYVSCYFGLGQPWEKINPIGKHQNHGVATLSSLVSTKMFGISEMSVRYPAIVFTVVFLLLVNILCLRYASNLTTFLVFSNLAVNQLALWFFHSMRGYISMMCFTLGALLVVLFSQDRRVTIGVGKIALFVGLLLLAMVSHTFGGIFAATLLLSLLVWLHANRFNLERTKLSQFYLLLLSGLMTLPVLAGILISNALDISAFGFLYAKASPPVNQELARLTGNDGSGLVFFAYALLGIMAFFQMKGRGSRKFVPTFLWVSFGLIFVLMTVVKANIVEGRMFLAFLVPLLFWWGESVASLKRVFPRIVATAMTITFLVVAPQPHGQELFNVIPQIQSPFKGFVAEVRARLPEGACAKATGLTYQKYWAENLYLHEFLKARPDCDPEYWILFEDGSERVAQFEEEQGPRVTKMFETGDGRALFSLQSVPSDLFAQHL